MMAAPWMVVLGLAVSTVFGITITFLLLPPSISSRVAWTLAPAAGLGVSSLIFVLFRRPMFTVEIVLLIAATVLLIRGKVVTRLSRISISGSLLMLVLSGALGFAAIGTILRVDRMPHGNWDGWAIWNTHARFLFRDGNNWKNDIQYSFHGDYPLLTSATAARLWRYARSDASEYGALLGIILAVSGVTLLGVTIAELRPGSAAVLLPIVLLSTPIYLDSATSQYADVPLSFFILATVALLALHFERGVENGRGTLALAGFMAGCAGWTKNEGLLFITAASAALLFPVWRTPSKTLRRFSEFACGLALPLLVIVVFKLTVPARNDLIEYQSNTIGKMLDAARHALILRSAGAGFRFFGQWSISPWLGLLGFAAFNAPDRRILRNTGWTTGMGILILVLAGYYVVYLVTPLDLQLHLDSSLDRLLIHVWPAFLLLLGLLPARSTA